MFQTTNQQKSTWWLIPLSKWVITCYNPTGKPGISRLNPLLGWAHPLSKWEEPPSMENHQIAGRNPEKIAIRTHCPLGKLTHIVDGCEILPQLIDGKHPLGLNHPFHPQDVFHPQQLYKTLAMLNSRWVSHKKAWHIYEKVPEKKVLMWKSHRNEGF